MVSLMLLFFHSSLIVWNACLLKSHYLNPCVVPCDIHSKMLSSLRGTHQLVTGEAGKETHHLQTQCHSSDDENLTILPWLKLFHLMALPSSCSSWFLFVLGNSTQVSPPPGSCRTPCCFLVCVIVVQLAVYLRYFYFCISNTYFSVCWMNYSVLTCNFSFSYDVY